MHVGTRVFSKGAWFHGVQLHPCYEYAAGKMFHLQKRQSTDNCTRTHVIVKAYGVLEFLPINTSLSYCARIEAAELFTCLRRVRQKRTTCASCVLLFVPCACGLHHPECASLPTPLPTACPCERNGISPRTRHVSFTPSKRQRVWNFPPIINDKTATLCSRRGRSVMLL